MGSKRVYSAHLCLAWFLASVNLLAVQGNKLDCSSVEPINLDSYSAICPGYIAEDAPLMQRMDQVQKCGCNLLRHDLAWQAMYTHEVEVLFYSLKEFVKQRDETQAEEIKGIKSSIVFDEDFDGKMYFWDRLSSILSKGESEASKVGKEIRTIFGLNFYDADTFRINSSSNQQSLKVSKQISSTCNTLNDNMQDFLKHFASLIQASENLRFVYRMATYDQTLYKLISVVKACQFLQLSGQRP